MFEQAHDFGKDMVGEVRQEGSIHVPITQADLSCDNKYHRVTFWDRGVWWKGKCLP